MQWWHVYPLGALGADTTGQDSTCHHSLKELIPWLDHARDLGLNGIALGPIFASELHGYDTLDYFQIDQRLGNLEDFHALVAAAHERGMKVMLDGVFNHISRNHPLLEDPAQAIENGLVHADNTGQPRAFEGHGQLIELKHSSPAVQDLIVEIMTHWLSMGADAWRLDAAYTLAPELWKPILGRVKERYPDVYIMGEVIHGDYIHTVTASGMDAVTEYELWKAIWSSLNDQNMHELAWTLKRHNEFTEAFLPYTFVGNHDVTRIATQVPAPLTDLTYVILTTVSGTPAIYYGDELDWTGHKEERFGGDDAIRAALPPFPPAPAERPDSYRLLQHLLSIRRRVPELIHSRTRPIAVDGPVIAYVCESNPEGRPLLTVALNSGENAVDVECEGGNLIAHRDAHQNADGIHLGPAGWAILAHTI
ncbi:alpha-amylase [Boudabousia marimammalium]|uniref:Alpha-amylase n=2 Tax=Boudabousia marimammalium TaxID=156892 RepID=A0A1Q5PNT9_9ACTO|nr:alpha-amylase [Boudabousia marimammalium]